MFIQPNVDLSTLQARRINIREEQTDDTKMPLARASCFGELSSKAKLGHDDVELWLDQISKLRD
ncbi:hypothetical protein CFAM422_001664 [Trichoderma lentiforme]|uniref:Uncharacterized protein n=1 Tax=Trichoderma lentiforme TaxID=1567552 RepID=A0A9P5CG78_9HYPO|nr:hypothetical protein CFAM422_001664 [Trichoderma lentiforme]